MGNKSTRSLMPSLSVSALRSLVPLVNSSASVNPSRSKSSSVRFATRMVTAFSNESPS